MDDGHDEDDVYKVEADGDESKDEEDHIKDDDYRTQPERGGTRTRRERGRGEDVRVGTSAPT